MALQKAATFVTDGIIIFIIIIIIIYFYTKLSHVHATCYFLVMVLAEIFTSIYCIVIIYIMFKMFVWLLVISFVRDKISKVSKLWQHCTKIHSK